MYDRRLETMIKIVECGSFNRAAEEMFMTSSSVIQKINQMESSLGFKIFNRTHQGVSLTPSGQIYYKAALKVIDYADVAIRNAKKLDDALDHTVRIGSSILFRPRVLPDLCRKASKLDCSLKFEVPPWFNIGLDNEGPYEFGVTHDIVECTFCDAEWTGRYNFLKITAFPFCLAVPKHHQLADKKGLSLEDIRGETLVTVERNVLTPADFIRDILEKDYPETKIVTSPAYEMYTFTQCELNNWLLLTSREMAEIHNNLVTIPLLEDFPSPEYGLVYSRNPTPATERFIKIADQLLTTDDPNLRINLKKLLPYSNYN